MSLRFHLPDCRILPLISSVSFLISSNRMTVHYTWRLVDSCGLLWTLTASAFGRWTAVIAGFIPLNMSVRRENFPSCQDRSGLVDIVKLLLMLRSLCVSGCVNGYLLSWALGTLSVMSVCGTWILLHGQAVWRWTYIYVVPHFSFFPSEAAYIFTPMCRLQVDVACMHIYIYIERDFELVQNGQMLHWRVIEESDIRQT